MKKEVTKLVDLKWIEISSFGLKTSHFENRFEDWKVFQWI